MRPAPASPAQDSATGDIAANLAAFGRSLRAANRSPATVESYTTGVAQFDEFLAGHGMPRYVAAIKREHVEAFVEDVLARWRPATAANRYRSLQQFFRWLVDEGEIPASPMVRMHPPRVPEEPPTILREEDKKALWKVTAGTDFVDRRDRVILRLFLDSGMRLAEIAGLRLDDIDKDLMIAHVLGKGGRPRAVPYDKEAAKELDRYILRARPEHPHSDLPWLWLGKKGRLTGTGIAQVVKRRGAEAGLEGLHPHLFRHTAAHEAMDGGMQESDVMRIFGWRSPQMVRRYGASAADERALKAYRTSKTGSDERPRLGNRETPSAHQRSTSRCRL